MVFSFSMVLLNIRGLSASAIWPGSLEHSCRRFFFICVQHDFLLEQEQGILLFLELGIHPKCFCWILSLFVCEISLGFLTAFPPSFSSGNHSGVHSGIPIWGASGSPPEVAFRKHSEVPDFRDHLYISQKFFLGALLMFLIEILQEFLVGIKHAFTHRAIF